MLEHAPLNEPWNSSIEHLKGRTIVQIEKRSEFGEGDDALFFILSDETEYKMYHSQSCCEHVYIEGVCGDFADLLNSEVLMAEESCPDLPATSEHEGSWTWTFYKLATIKGYVTIRWYGSSNGCYSESVNFERVK